MVWGTRVNLQDEHPRALPIPQAHTPGMLVGSFVLTGRILLGEQFRNLPSIAARSPAQGDPGCRPAALRRRGGRSAQAHGEASPGQAARSATGDCGCCARRPRRQCSRFRRGSEVFIDATESGQVWGAGRALLRAGPGGGQMSPVAQPGAAKAGPRNLAGDFVSLLEAMALFAVRETEARRGRDLAGVARREGCDRKPPPGPSAVLPRLRVLPGSLLSLRGLAPGAAKANGAVRLAMDRRGGRGHACRRRCLWGRCIGCRPGGALGI
ncbi:uncharacterized protein LOC121102447 [Ursus maritimus]|uniref:Uncharacterized protein LOC121102447 n=1 Tax=Ursus maritimus TaxID=29073 RepID=A0A8M1FLI2_URSMA|nr:uncharacterized protein LOC121102447 [Ursus maritimus]